MMKLIVLVAGCLCFAMASASAASLPPYFKLAPGVAVGNVGADENYGEAVIPTLTKEDAVQRGHRWSAALTVTGVPADASGKVLWAKLRSALQQAGWTVVAEWDSNPFSATVRNTQGRDAWAYVKLFGADDIRMELIEVGGSKMAFKMAPPADKPETFKAESGDFPFLPPLPGAKFASGAADPSPFTMALPGSDEQQVVADGSVTKSYVPATTTSVLEFGTVYRDALKAAGWTVVYQTEGLTYTDSVLISRYAKNGRDLWAYIHFTPAELSMRVGDAGRKDMAATLKKDCRVVLTGVFFDFDKASLKPESDPTLQRARDALKANAAQGYEVQGHTDAVGKDDYNQKLSEARAKTVSTWFAANGIAATQVVAKGYGKTKPIASNDSDEGRARNRRVELVCRK